MIENKNIVEMRPKLHHFYAFTHFTLHLCILIHIFFPSLIMRSIGESLDSNFIIVEKQFTASFEQYFYN